jgi:hypothetical protein
MTSPLMILKVPRSQIESAHYGVLFIGLIF